MSQPIFSYFASVADLDVEAELRLACLWKERWSAIGFEPIILNEWVAMKHPMYQEFNEAVSKLPTCNPIAYEKACWMRWMSLAVAGGGFMADLDVMPTTAQRFVTAVKPPPETIVLYALMPDHLETSKVHIYQTPCCPSFVYCSKENAEDLCIEFSTRNLGRRPQGDREHASDQYFLEDLVKADASFVEVHDIVKQYPDEGWQKAPLIHYPNAAMAPRGKTPKYKFIPQLLEEARKAT